MTATNGAADRRVPGLPCSLSSVPVALRGRFVLRTGRVLREHPPRPSRRLGDVQPRGAVDCAAPAVETCSPSTVLTAVRQAAAGPAATLLLSPDAGGWMTLSFADRARRRRRRDVVPRDAASGGSASIRSRTAAPTFAVALPPATRGSGDRDVRRSADVDRDCAVRAAARPPAGRSPGASGRGSLAGERGRPRSARRDSPASRTSPPEPAPVQWPRDGRHRDQSAQERDLRGARLLSLFSVALIVTRYVYSGEQLYGWLIWNLLLAWIPFGLAIVIYDRHRAGCGRLGCSRSLCCGFCSSRTRPTSSPTSSTSFRARSSPSGSTSS